MPKATDQEILAASYALRVARADLNVAFDAEMAAERELVARQRGPPGQTTETPMGIPPVSSSVRRNSESITTAAFVRA